MPRKSLTITSESKKLYTTKRFLEECYKLKISSTWVNPYNTHLLLSGKSSKIQPDYLLHRTTGIRYDDFDLTFSLAQKNLGTKIVNSIYSLKHFRNKDDQILFLKKENLNFIPSLSFRGDITSEIRAAIDSLKTKKYILKMSRGNQGIGVNLIESKKSLIGFLDTFYALDDQKFLIQPFLLSTKEYRVFVINNEIHAIVEKKISANDFRGNANKSTTKLITKLPKEIEVQILTATLKSGLTYAGIDIVITTKNDFYFLEINAIPGFENIENLSNKNIAREILLSFYNK